MKNTSVISRLSAVALVAVCAALGGCLHDDPPAKAQSTFTHADGPAAGLSIEILKPGTGEPVTEGMNVSMHYTGWIDEGDGKRGKKFDSSRNPGRQPFEVRNLGRAAVIAGWNLGIATVGECAGMKLGEIRRLLIPYPLAYGENGHPGGIPPKANLIFEVELMSIGDTE
jgi:FKBP-type peptidyl-prolyl cis-trans isomerase